MEYFKKIKLSCENIIKSFVINDVRNQLDLNSITTQVRVKHNLPDDLRTCINAELASIGFPELLYCQSYLRNKKHIQGIHVDGDNDTLINAAINIPILGVLGSKHNWYTGDYTTYKTNRGDLFFHNILWKSVPQLISTLELDQSYLVRVNKPHSVIADDNNCRWIFTMRFVDNPSFEYLYDKLPD